MPGAVLQPKIYPLPSLRRPGRIGPFFKKNIVICDDEGWSLTFSGSTWRIDCYEYAEGDRKVTFGGEGAAGQWDVFVPRTMAWDGVPNDAMDEATRYRVLHRVTAAIQWMGLDVGLFEWPKN